MPGSEDQAWPKRQDEGGDVTTREMRLLAADNIEQLAKVLGLICKGFGVLLLALLALLAVALDRPSVAQLVSHAVTDAAWSSIGAGWLAAITWAWARDARMGVDKPVLSKWKRALEWLANGPILIVPVLLLTVGCFRLLDIANKLPSVVSALSNVGH